MPKQVTMWENVDGDLFETELEANESEAKSALEKLGVKESDFDAFEKLLSNPELQVAFSKWMTLSHQVIKLIDSREAALKQERQAKCKHVFHKQQDGSEKCYQCYLRKPNANNLS